MLFNSLEFVLFFVVVYVVYRRLALRGQNLFLLAASYVFYGSWDWRFLSLILASTAVDFYCGRQMHATDDVGRRRTLMLASLVFNLGLLGVFKYFNFFADSLQALFASLGVDLGRVTLEVILPVGISFYTFQTLSYTIDIYRRRLEPEPSFLNFALFVSFFPQLVAGPIERAAHLLPQVRHSRSVSGDDVAQGLWFVSWGYFLKVFVADNLGPIADRAFDATHGVDGVASVLGAYAFAFQIFGDFAGYSSIAIGIARLMGFHLSTNFLFPYWVTNPRDFWRNWHISLSTWLRDYLYIPLGGGRGTRWRVARNLMLTMLLGGLWHGAAWTFVAWGLFHGLLLVAHRAVESVAGPARLVGDSRPGRFGWAVKVFLMFQLTCVGWLIFRAPSLDRLGAMLGSIVTGLHWPTTAQVFDGLHILFYAGLVLVIQATQIRAGERTDLAHLPAWARVATVGLMFYAIVIWGSFGESPFIYFQF
jgi:D-alanyl-lipoteichoic acid acyltransferase DltB (MBOAT superfamily)